MIRVGTVGMIKGGSSLSGWKVLFDGDENRSIAADGTYTVTSANIELVESVAHNDSAERPLKVGDRVQLASGWYNDGLATGDEGVVVTVWSNVATVRMTRTAMGINGTFTFLQTTLELIDDSDGSAKFVDFDGREQVVPAKRQPAKKTTAITPSEMAKAVVGDEPHGDCPLWDKRACDVFLDLLRFARDDEPTFPTKEGDAA